MAEYNEQYFSNKISELVKESERINGLKLSELVNNGETDTYKNYHRDLEQVDGDIIHHRHHWKKNYPSSFLIEVSSK